MLRAIPAILAATALAFVSACEVNVQEGGNETAQTNQAAPAPTPAPDPQGQSNPEAVKRARDLALGLGSETQRAQARQQAQQQFQNLRYEVDISDRKLRIFQGDRLVEDHDVAVGTEEWPTPTGEWSLNRVDINPEWVPPKEEEWAEDEEVAAPGDPDNPLGTVRLVYRLPNTIHGTYDLASLGKASSHGSIRVANEVAIRLAEMLLRAGGAWEGPQWFQQMQQNKTQEFQIELPDHIPIVVQE